MCVESNDGIRMKLSYQDMKKEVITEKESKDEIREGEKNILEGNLSNLYWEIFPSQENPNQSFSFESVEVPFIKNETGKTEFCFLFFC